MRPGNPTKVVIDRIEGDLAVLVSYSDDRVKFNVPVSLLPEGTREGDHLQITFAKDQASRESEQKRIDDLLKELKHKP